MNKPVRLYEGEGRHVRRSPDLKTSLIELTLDLGALVASVDRRLGYGGSSLVFEGSLTPFEQTILLLEDRRYFVHGGFDVFCIPRLAKRVLLGRGWGGVSTIEQQFVRTLIERKERTVRRKTREIVLACLLKYHRSKMDILRAYLVAGYFGYKCRGSEGVSKLLFGYESAKLTGDDAALVASLLVYPLPKQVYAAIKAANSPVGSYEAVLSLAEDLAPRWVRRVRRRVNYARKLTRNAEKPLQKEEYGDVLPIGV